jgi:hypothetical protein
LSNPEFVPDPRLSTLSIKIEDIDKMDEALQQAKNVLMHPHRGIEDFPSAPGERVRRHHAGD